MEVFFTRPWLKAFSAVSINLASGYFALGFITPNFLNPTTSQAIRTLTQDIIFGIVFLLISVMLNQIIDNE